mmetsp:Transcript_6322/g.8536  ORF Transcript_6322/g.8536 Transcript_6322/m.8536 type:complete len:592 (-) Transcript_6322:506-2281(-)
MGSSRRSSAGAGAPAKDQTRLRIERMEAEREERRRLMQERKIERAEEEQRNLAAGNPGDVDFIGLVRKWRESHSDTAYPLSSAKQQPKICIAVRKRPVSDKERAKRDHDSVTCFHPTVWVHSAKLRVDGITKYLDHNSFRFDYSFDETSTTEDVYNYSAMPLIDFVCSGKGGRATVFAYGQTGSGKTYTMNGIQSMVADDLFHLLSSGDENNCTLDNTIVTVTFFEIYGGRIVDLLNNRHRLKVLEDGKGEVVVSGLEEFESNDPEEFFALVDAGNRKRTTHSTEANDTSSRSHAICQILLRDKDTSRLRGKLSLVDLAGSERGDDTKSHNRQRRTESSEINTSLLALKECIRALDSGRGGRHVPYRASKLTLILKDCFTSNLARTTMIATVSPGASSADHTLNTLRYADRIKEKKVGGLSKGKGAKVGSSPAREPSRVKSASPSPVRSEIEDTPKKISSSPPEEDIYDLDLLNSSMEELGKDEVNVEEKSEVAQLHCAVQNLLEEEEELLNLHMSIIQENAELLTEEGKLLQSVQGDDVVDYDIDQYASRLGSILDRKTHLSTLLQEKLTSFRSQLKKEEELSKKINHDL